MGATLEPAERNVHTRHGGSGRATRAVASQALLDYLGVTLAGADEPLVRMLLEQVEAEGGHPQATVIGTGHRTSVRQAALLNGAAGHAHDYDYVPGICFKYHAACYLTHSAIEAARALRAAQRIDPAAVDAVEARVNEGHFGVCHIQSPETGLEPKFSLRFTVALDAGLNLAALDRLDPLLQP